MSDIFREVEEDVRRERLEKFWKDYGDYLIALAALIILGIGGFELWQRHETAQREKASAAFIAAQHVASPADAAKAFAALAANAPGGYGILSRMAEANSVAVASPSEAVTLYRQIAGQDTGPVGAVARLRAAWLLVDTAPRNDVDALLKPLETPDGAWRQMAQEILAYWDYHAKKLTAAAAEFQALAQDNQAPDMLRERARAFAAFLTSGGATNYGTVPPPAPVPQPGAAPGSGQVTGPGAAAAP